MAILSRRTFFAAGGSLVALGLVGFGGSAIWCGRESLSATLPLERLDVALADIAAPTRIGQAYLAREGHAAVEAMFLAKTDLVTALAIECPETRRGRIREVARADFSAGDVVIADRWIVARSECLVAALRHDATSELV